MYKDWGVCSYEEHRILAKIYHDQQANRTKTKTVEYSVKGGFELSFYGGLKMHDLGGLRINRC